MKPIVRFFGDGDHAFALNQPQITELEHKCGPIADICGRAFHRQFSTTDLSEVIRLSLVGAGENPKRAAELVALYVTNRPFSETFPIVLTILETVWFGEPHEVSAK